MINIQYMHILSENIKNICTSYRNRYKNVPLGEAFCTISYRVQIYFYRQCGNIDVGILHLSCNVKKPQTKKTKKKQQPTIAKLY